MAFLAEIKAKLGLDTTGFSRALTKTQADVGKVGTDIQKKLHRSFGGGDVFKGLLQGIGIGSVGQVTDLIARPFELAAERAKNMESFTGSMAEIATKEIAALNGQNAAMRITEQHARAINVEMGIQQRLIDDLRSNPLTFISPASMQMLIEAENALSKMKVDQAKMMSDLKVGTILRKRQSDDTIAAAGAADRIAVIERRNGSEREKELVRLSKINRDIRKAYARGAGVDAVSALWSQHGASVNRLAGLDAAARKQIGEMLVSSGSAAAGGGKGRGRTETERIADRGARFKALSEDAVMRGNKADAARYAAAAVRDFTSAGKKKAEGASLIARGDAQKLQSEILAASESLSKAARELEPKQLR